MKSGWILFFVSGILIALPGTGLSQNSIAGAKEVTVQEEYLIPADVSRLEAERILLQRARTRAVEKVTGVLVQVADLMTTTETGNELFESFRKLIRNVVKGRIVDEEPPVYTTGENNMLYITYRCKVMEEAGSPDPDFRVEMRANKEVFTVGESLQLQVETSQASYLTIFSVTEDNKVSVMFPNAYMPDNQVEANTLRQIPNERESRIISFTMQPLADGSDRRYSELLLCVATKSKMTYDELTSRLSYDSDWTELNKWLMSIPRNQWTEDYVQYQVFPR